MSLGKFTASIASGTQETTVALAALNFDFSVFKTEAPAEYKPLGTALSSHRRVVAEDGDIHSTARKLRAIFEQLLPTTPSLYKAYGKRASEIARDSQLSSHDTVASGAFAELLGVDGGSVWAAATSGPGAIAIHLLACMLAKIWSAPEATSIWEEIVSARKEQLSIVDESDPQNVFAGWAAKCTLSRQQLANWDASARAWLRSADDKHRIRQKQLKLIIENIDLPVNSKISVYDSVITAWLSAMVALNKLIEGMPHSIENSAILLALSAWHLFPNMSVLSTENHFIKQDDPLIDPRGILTLGLQSAVSVRERRDSHDMGKGITWSLPLAYYRFYGDPVETEKALNTDGSRISIAQLLQVCLGCMFAGLKQKDLGVVDAAQLMLDIWHSVANQADVGALQPLQKHLHRLSEHSWLAILARGAKDFLESRDLDRSEYTRLFNYGRRRRPQFIGLDQRSLSPIVKLMQPGTLLGLMNTHNARIDLLRRTALRLNCDPTDMVIRYGLPDKDGNGGFTYALATVVPIKTAESESITTHMRWSGKANVNVAIKQEANHIGKGSYEPIMKANILGPLEDGMKFFWSEAPLHFSGKEIMRTEVDAFFGSFAEFALFRGNVQRGKPRVLEGIPFELLFGDPKIAAIYRIRSGEEIASNLFNIDDVRTAMGGESNLITQSALLQHLGEVHPDDGSVWSLSKHIRSLKTLATLCKVYKDLGNATVAMALTTRELHNFKWMPKTDLSATVAELAPSRLAATKQKVQLLQAFEPLELDLASTFACIAMLESGNIDLTDAGMQSVIAMSSGDSLFISTSLVSDPSQHLESKIRRIRGNVGRAGIAMLVPPEEPRTRKAEAQDWNYLNYDEFDGLLLDSFKATSLHMSFTDFVLPIDTGVRGLRDTEIYFLETVISVHDKGQWMGDLNVMPIYRSPLLRLISYNNPCTHGHIDSKQADPDLISIDSWHEFFDRPADSTVFRARGNWMARLAASTISVTQGHLTLVFGEQICWKCGEEERGRLSHKSKPIFII